MKALYIFAFFVLAVTVSNLSLGPSTLPSKSELFPPAAESEVREKAKAFEHRPNIVAKYMDIAIKKSNAPLSTVWWAKYTKAQALETTHKNLSCEIYGELASDKKFPLHSLAKINHQKNCLKNLTNIDNSESELKNELMSAQLDLAIEQEKPEKQIEILVKKSKVSVIYDEKIELMQKAIRAARKSNLDLTKLETRLYRLSPSRMENPPRKKYLAVAKDLAKRRLFKKARVYYRKVIRSKKFNLTKKIQAYKGLAKSYKLQLDRERELKATEEMESYVFNRLKPRGFSKWECRVYTKINIQLARTEWTQHMAGRGRRTLNKLVSHCADKANLATAHWILGRMHEEKGHFKSAKVQYKKAKQEVEEKSDIYNKVLWNLAWSEYKTKNYSQTIENLQTLVDQEDTGLTAEKYRFWLAKSYKQVNDHESANEHFEGLIQDTPLSFYSYLSQRELGLKLNKKEILKSLTEQQIAKVPESLVQDFDEVYFEWLLAVNETGIAKDYLTSLSQNLRSSKRTDDLNAWVYVFNQFARLDSHVTIFQKLWALEESLRQEIFHNYHHLLFPMPYSEAVTSSAARFGVRAEYIYAIMRQESAFDPNARSHMDAFGLMQLIPEVAKVTAEKNNIVFKGPADLYDPKTSIMIGTSHLKELLDRYEGNLVLAIASYNANERAINNWMKTRYKGNTLEFIEDIPYKETSNYVKLVLRNLYTYTLFKSGNEETQFPEWSLAMTEN